MSPRNPEYEYNLDPQGRVRLPGIYSANVVAINDPLNKSRIKVMVNQPTGVQITNWAEACLPVHQNAIHPDHKPHLATFTTSAAEGHVHQVTVSFDNHQHEESTDPQETDTVNEHTAHRIIPRIGQSVWVMFKAGDPEHPVWIGVQHD